MKLNLLLVTSVLFFIGGSQGVQLRPIDPTVLSGNLHIRLKHGVWKLWEEKPVYQDITLDLTCDRGECQPEVWGYSPRFNKEVDHQGVVQDLSVDSVWRLHLKLQVKSHPWRSEMNTAEYEIQLFPHEGKLVGSYTGKFKDKLLLGSVQGTLTSQWPNPIPNYQPITPQEHPRLVFSRDQLPQLRQKAKTPYGEAILTQLNRVLQGTIYYEGYGPNSGYHGAGHCFLSILNENQESAIQGWELVQKTMENPPPRLLERSNAVTGIALAYDLCYSSWTQEQRQQVTHWLAMQIVHLVNGDSPSKGWNSNAASNWNARARSAALLAALAIWQEPQEFFPNNQFYQDSEDLWYWLKVAERNIERYIQFALGDRTFGTEGDLYTRESLYQLLPALQAYERVLGKDWVSEGKMKWILPHYLMRMVNQDNGVKVPTYGRHRLGPDGSLFTLGFPVTSDRFLPALVWFFDRHWGLEGDRTFGIHEHTPHDAIYALVGYPDDVAEQNPVEIFDRVLVDEQKQFYVFRNQWQDKNDFITSIYLKGESRNTGSWSFPDAGSFRIWGLGEQWAIAGPSEGRREDENVVVVPNVKGNHGSKLLFFESDRSGSGIVSLGYKNWLRSFAVDYTGRSGVPGLFAVVDRFEQSLVPTLWVMHTAGKVTLESQGFTITSDSGATLNGRFILPEAVKLTYETTETGGKIQASGYNQFFVVMTVQKGNAPPIKVEGRGLNSVVRVGEQRVQFQGDRLQLHSHP